MKKEIAISVIIIVSIIIGDILLQNYTRDSFNSISEKLQEMKVTIYDKEISKEKINTINALWEKKFKVLTCFIEHNELEKVKTQLVEIASGIEVDDSEFVYEEIDRAIYIIDHIREKGALKVDNIF